MTTTRSTPFTVQIQHDQVDTAGYELLLNGTLHATAPVDPAGVQFPFPQGLPAGTYTLVVRAVRAPGYDPTDPAEITHVDSDPVDLVVVPGVPSKPVLLILVG